jgi:hypothetical protein
MPESPQTEQTAAAPQKKVSPQLVRDVANKVYDLWLRDLAIEEERKRFS